MVKSKSGNGRPAKKKSPQAEKPVRTPKREAAIRTAGPNNLARTERPKRVSSSDASSELTEITTPAKKKKRL